MDGVNVENYEGINLKMIIVLNLYNIGPWILSTPESIRGTLPKIGWHSPQQERQAALPGGTT